MKKRIKSYVAFIILAGIFCTFIPPSLVKAASSTCKLSQLGYESWAPRNIRGETTISGDNVNVKITWDKPKPKEAGDTFDKFEVSRYIDKNTGEEQGTLIYEDKKVIVPYDATKPSFEFTDTIKLGVNTGYLIVTVVNMGSNTGSSVDMVKISPDGTCGTKQNNNVANPEEYYPAPVDSEIKFNGDNAPTIEIPKDATDPEGRPKVLFKLTKAILQGAPNNCNSYDTHWDTIDNSIITRDQVYFYFTYVKSTMADGTEETEDPSKYGTIRIDTGGNSKLVIPGAGSVTDTVLDAVTININKDSIWKLYNHAFNGRVSGSTSCGAITTPPAIGSTYNADSAPFTKCLNVNGTKGYCPDKKPMGWLGKWGVTGQASSVIDPSGGTAPGEQDACGSAGMSITKAILVGLCSLTVMFRDWAMNFICFAQNKLELVLGQAGAASSKCDTKYQKDPEKELIDSP